MKISNLKQAKKIYLEGNLDNQKALLQGNSKEANRYARMVETAIIFIKKNHNICNLAEFLNHEDINIRIITARYLLPILTDESLAVLQEIVVSDIPGKSFTAKYAIDSWNDGTYDYG